MVESSKRVNSGEVSSELSLAIAIGINLTIKYLIVTIEE
jgi:hypothetical protein